MISFKPLNPNDMLQLSAIVSLDQEIAIKYGFSFSDRGWTVENFVCDLPEKFILSHVAYSYEQVAGYCIASMYKDETYLHRFVAKKIKGEDVAGVLIHELIRKSPCNILLMVNSINAAAISFYQRHGFRVVEDRNFITKIKGSDIDVENNLIMVGEHYRCYLMQRKY